MRKYTMTDRLENLWYDLRFNLYMNWPGRFAPLASIRILAAAANAARLVGATRLARFLVQWSWDIADVPIGLHAAAFDLHREVLPWAWGGRSR
jgi:hypothetical protein